MKIKYFGPLDFYTYRRGIVLVSEKMHIMLGVIPKFMALSFGCYSYYEHHEQGYYETKSFNFGLVQLSIRWNIFTQ